jgi:hypothetical protein
MVKFSDIEQAFDFVNSGQPYEHTAFVSRSTGETYWQSEISDVDELPEDVAEDEDFVEIPHGNDLDLGTRLVWDFVRQFVPELHDQVESAFSRKGAYSRFKGILERHGSLDKWYKYEEDRTTEALVEWCKANDLEVNYDL